MTNKLDLIAKYRPSLMKAVLASREGGVSYRELAAFITKKTGEPVTHETVRAWLVAKGVK